jgi:hypothetical protein
MCGYENLIYGDAIPGLGGKDGIKAGDERLAHTSKGENGVVGEKVDGDMYSVKADEN